MAPRYFTLAQAQALLPHVRTSLGSALQLHAHLRRKLATLQDHGVDIDWPALRGQTAPETQDEFSRLELERARGIYSTLRELITELESRGVELKSVTKGLVDFPSWCDGEREVLLCYRLGEADITHFHGLDEDFDERVPLEGHAFTSSPSTQDEQAEEAGHEHPPHQP